LKIALKNGTDKKEDGGAPESPACERKGPKINESLGIPRSAGAIKKQGGVIENTEGV